jgi:molecular chaperone HscB
MMSCCWQCDAELGDKLFCLSCNALQAPEPEYFSIFGLAERLSVDTADLQRRFYSLSRQFHPDRYTRATERERAHSLEATAILNDAYRTLRDPVQRAEYVLKRAGFDIGEQRTKDVPPELLEEVFELNMALEEIRGGDESVRPQLEAARTRFHGLLDAIDEELLDQFERYDAQPERAALGAIRAILNRRRYIVNLVRSVDKELSTEPDNVPIPN